MRRKSSLPLQGLVLPLLFLLAGLVSGCSGGVRPTAYTSLVIRDDVLYVADLEQVRALDTGTGDVLWSFPPEPDPGQYGPFYTVAISEDEEVLFVTSYERTGGGLFAQSRGVLRALSIEDRRPLWEFSEAGGEFMAAGAATNDTLIIGNSDGNVYGFQVEDGSPAWDQPFTTGGRVWATPLILSDTVYIASLDHKLYALDPETGREQWERPFEAGSAMAGQPLALGDTLFVGAFGNSVYALDAGTGEQRWHFQGENWFWGTPASDGALIYAVDVSGNVYALDATNGREIWPSRPAVDPPVRLGPLLSDDGKVLVIAGDNGTLHGLDTEDGFELWQRPGEGQLASAAVEGDVVYVTRINATQRIQAFYVENGRHLWPEPESGEE